jgi:hypothetical protein
MIKSNKNGWWRKAASRFALQRMAALPEAEISN